MKKKQLRRLTLQRETIQRLDLATLEVIGGLDGGGGGPSSQICCPPGPNSNAGSRDLNGALKLNG